MTRKNTTLKRAKEFIYSAHYPLLICHVSPDGDAIGSLMGLTRALRQMGRNPTAACSDPIPFRFSFVPGAGAILQDVDDSFDLVITLDCSDRKRIGHFADLPGFDQHPLINVDHHITNTGFGDVNLVNPQASSTAEVLLRLLEYMAVPIDADLATCLLTGIVTDTRGFRTSNVTPQVMDAARRLMEAGASLPNIAQHSLDHRPTDVLRLWGAALSQLQTQDGVIWTCIPLAMRRAVGYQGDGDTGLTNFLVSADTADVSVVFAEREGGRVEVGLRAIPGFDVARIAIQFGGGGHTLAAGFNIPGSLEEVQDRVLAELQADLARQRQSHA